MEKFIRRKKAQTEKLLTFFLPGGGFRRPQSRRTANIALIKTLHILLLR
jgi:hypothetical protein